jgi:hypothetical protein
VAPGVDVPGPRAYRTDFMHVLAGQELGVKPNERVVDEAWYRADGTSFAAPLVTGAAAFLWAEDPALTAEQITSKLVMSCDDLGPPGWDPLTGAGRLNAAAALAADPDQSLETKVLGARAEDRAGARVLAVSGTAACTHFQARRLELAFGADPAPGDWQTVLTSREPVQHGLLGDIPGRLLDQRGTWTIRSVVEDSRGAVRQSQTTIVIK